MKKKNPVIFVVGATASGKSSWALQLAEQVQACVVNCDSVQVYRGLSVGAAMPTPLEMSRVPHHLYAYVQAPQAMTAGEYSRDFFSLMEEIPEGQPVFVVGGTGFYFQALEKGMYSVEKISPELQQEIAETLKSPEGVEKLYRELREKDPRAAEKIHLADRYRIGRAIELLRTHQKTLTEIRQSFAENSRPFPFPLFKAGLEWPRDQLWRRIEQRTNHMLSSGLVAEVKSLLDQGLEQWAPLSSVGYKEVIEYLQKNRSEEWLGEQITLHTRQLAKRQKTWFQRDMAIHWYAGDSEFAKFKNDVLAFLEASQS